MEELKETLKKQIIEALSLEEIVLMEKNYGIRLNNPAEGKAIFTSVNSMAEYIAKHRTK